MHHFEVQWMPEADQDLEDIVAFLRLYSTEKAAQRMLDTIFGRVKLLQTFPYLGKRDPWLEHLDGSYHYISIGYYRIVYSLEGATISIERVFDQRKNPLYLIIRE